MSPTAITLILIAAVAHASWNLFSKQASTTGAVFFVWSFATCATVIYLPVAIVAVIVSHPHLTSVNWLFMAVTGLLQAGYFLFLQLGYTMGDLSVVYPIGRGAGAMLAAAAGIVLLGERPSLLSVAGIVAIIAGVVVIGLPAKTTRAEAAPTEAAPTEAAPTEAAPTEVTRAKGRAVGFALVTGLFIASYTIWDKYAVSTLHTPPILQGYASTPIMVAVFAPFVLRDRQRLAQVWGSFKRQALGAAVLSPLAYMLVLIALSFTAVSVVAPAREVSVLFGVLLGRRMLGEGNLARRLAAAAAIVAGIIAIALR